MFKFIKGILSESDGTPSSRRAVLFILTFLFVGIAIYNIVTGKNLDEILKTQLYNLLFWLFVVIFGDKVVGIFNKYTGNTPLGGGGGDRPKDPPPNP